MDNKNIKRTESGEEVDTELKYKGESVPGRESGKPMLIKGSWGSRNKYSPSAIRSFATFITQIHE